MSPLLAWAAVSLAALAGVPTQTGGELTVTVPPMRWTAPGPAPPQEIAVPPMRWTARGPAAPLEVQVPPMKWTGAPPAAEVEVSVPAMRWKRPGG